MEMVFSLDLDFLDLFFLDLDFEPGIERWDKGRCSEPIRGNSLGLKSGNCTENPLVAAVRVLERLLGLRCKGTDAAFLLTMTCFIETKTILFFFKTNRSIRPFRTRVRVGLRTRQFVERIRADRMDTPVVEDHTYRTIGEHSAGRDGCLPAVRSIFHNLPCYRRRQTIIN